MLVAKYFELLVFVIFIIANDFCLSRDVYCVIYVPGLSKYHIINLEQKLYDMES